MYKMSLVHLRIKPRQPCHHLQIGNHTKALTLVGRRGGVEVVGWTVDQTIRFDSRLTLSVRGLSDARRLKTSSDVRVFVSR